MLEAEGVAYDADGRISADCVVEATGAVEAARGGADGAGKRRRVEARPLAASPALPPSAAAQAPSAVPQDEPPDDGAAPSDAALRAATLDLVRRRGPTKTC
mmetsp:Transcript_11871/g.40988  ORF Transcript_11871/g.40988 Transcript_11871/m.40988 type:complete len:101 (+) Transcript_11871:400-702(+)